MPPNEEAYRIGFTLFQFPSAFPTGSFTAEFVATLHNGSRQTAEDRFSVE